MMMKATKLTIVGALLAVTIGIAIAQSPEQHKGPSRNPEAFKELRQTMLSWARSAILPSLTQWKEQLDRAMEPADLQKLNELRARAATLRKEAAEHMKAMGAAWKSEDYEALKSHREALKGMTERKQGLLEELKPLALKYRSTLEQIGETAKPQIEQWKKEGKEKVEQWLAAHKDELGQGDRGFHGMFKHWGRLSGMGRDRGKKKAVVRFMLWDGTDFAQELEGMIDQAPLEGFDLK